MRVPLSTLIDLARKQAVYIAAALIVASVFWAVGQEINPWTILVYSISIGNLTSLSMQSIYPLYGESRFPYNWIIFLALLSAVLLPVYVVSSVLVWWIAPPSSQTLLDYVRTGWKFPILVMFVFGVLHFLYHSTRKHLERRNQELQRTVEAGATRLEQQEEELRRAREIQQSLLPKEIPQLPGFEVAGAWRPARMVSGDYFDVFRLGDHRLCICIADVVGKGVSAALLMANAQAAVRALSGQSAGPATVCGRVNRLLCENIATGKFVTFFYAILDAETRTLEYCNAGHPGPILVSHGQAHVLNDSGAVLGVFPAWSYEDCKVELNAADRLLLFTDGITEAEAPNEGEFGEERVAAFAEVNRRKSARELTDALLEHVSAFCGGQFQDDATLVIVAAD